MLILLFDANFEGANDCLVRRSQPLLDPSVVDAGNRRASSSSSGRVVWLHIEDSITPGWRFCFIESSFLA